MLSPFARRVRHTIAAVVAMTLVVGLAKPTEAEAEGPPVTFTDAQIANSLFGPAVRVKDDGVTYDRNVVLTAELLDWRDRNPAATQATVTAHLHSTVQAVGTGLSQVDQDQFRYEVVGRVLQVVYAAPGAVRVGPQLTEVLAVLTGRDFGPAPLHVGQRLDGAQQAFATDAAYSKFQASLWSTLRDRGSRDAALATAWQSELGKPTTEHPNGLSPAFSLAQLKAFPKLSALVNVDLLVQAGRQGQTQFFDELKRQLIPRQITLTGSDTEIARILNDLLQQSGQPGRGNASPKPMEEVTAREKARTSDINGAKAVFDFSVWLANFIDPGFAKHLAGFAETAYKIATGTIKLYSAIETLGTAVTIGGSTFGMYGAVIGAALGLIQVFSGLMSGGDPVLAASKQIITMLQSGFAQIQRNLATIATVMNKRFDQVNKNLKTMFEAMNAQFAEVLRVIYEIQGDLKTVHRDLLSIASQLQAFRQDLINQVSDADKTAFQNDAQKYVDYLKQNGGPIPSYDTTANNYVEGVNRFQTTATATARNHNFIYTNFANPDTDAAVAAHGPAGSIDYLAAKARSYGLPITASETVPNADLWAQAARAYYLTALQNPAYAGRETDERRNQLIRNGNLIRDTAAQFGKPKPPTCARCPFPPWQTTNNLFHGLYHEYRSRIDGFKSGMQVYEKDSSVQPPDRPFDLFAGPYQTVDIDRAGASYTPTAGPAACGGPAAWIVPKPNFITGRNLPKPLLFGRYLNKDWTHQSCWTNPHFRTPYTNTRTRCEETELGVKCYYSRSAMLNVEFRESVTIPGVGPVLARVTQGTRIVQSCYWSSLNPTSNPPPGCAPDQTDPRAAALAGVGSFGGVYYGVYAASTATEVPDAGAGPADKEANPYRAKYYELVASKLAANRGNSLVVPEATRLNSTVRLLRAYTELGFPRTKATDEELSAYLYGDRMLIADLPERPVLTAIYAKAATNLRAGLSACAGQEELLDTQFCGEPSGEDDPLATWVVNDTHSRIFRLMSRYELHSRQLYNNHEKQTLPMVDETIRNLELLGTYIRTQYPLPPTAKAPATTDATAPRKGGGHSPTP